ncbi:hypothetical protein Tco_0831098, partial [Tanacetum coccineum]
HEQIYKHETVTTSSRKRAEEACEKLRLSFGVLLLELLTRKAPLPASSHDKVVDYQGGSCPWFEKSGLHRCKVVSCSVVREVGVHMMFDEELMKVPHVDEEDGACIL